MFLKFLNNNVTLYQVDCTMGDLFFNSWSTASLYYVVNHPLFIAGIILLILLILLIVFVCCYSTYWKKKKEIELLVKNPRYSWIGVGCVNSRLHATYYTTDRL